MSDPIAPHWFVSAPYWYNTHIDWDSTSMVVVRRATRDQQVSIQAPGTLILRLQTQSRTTRIFDAEERECGSIRSEGIVPGVRFVMRRNDAPTWALTVRSVVRKRHQLTIVDGDVWTFDTPFFWWQHLSGRVSGEERLTGGLGPSTRNWGFVVDENKNTVALLAAVAFMHWKWWHW